MRHVDELRTERLLMRRWLDADRAPFAELNADPDVMRYFPAPEDRAGSDRAIDRFEQRFDEQGYGLWALELLATGEFIGFTGLNPMPEVFPVRETRKWAGGWPVMPGTRATRPRQRARHSTSDSSSSDYR